MAGALRKYRISRPLMIGHLLHEVVVLRGEVVALVPRRRMDTVGLLPHLLDAGRGLAGPIVATGIVLSIH